MQDVWKIYILYNCTPTSNIKKKHLSNIISKLVLSQKILKVQNSTTMQINFNLLILLSKTLLNNASDEERLIC